MMMKEDGVPITFWSYHFPTKLFQVTMSKTMDSIAKLRVFLQKKHRLSSNDYTLFTPSPETNELKPVSATTSLSKAVLLCIPRNKICITIKSPTGSHEILLNPMRTVLDLKTEICRQVGHPVSQQELLHDGKALRNRCVILDVDDIRESGWALQIFLQPAPMFVVRVVTFWNATYNIVVSASMTCEDVFKAVIRRTYSSVNRSDWERHRRVLGHLFLLVHRGRILERERCVGLYAVGAGSSLHLLSVGQARRDDTCVVTIVDSRGGERCHVRCARYDRWLVVALRLHDILQAPVDHILLSSEGYAIDLHGCVRAALSQGCVTVQLGVPGHCSAAVTLQVKLACGVYETLTGGARDTARDLLALLSTRRLAHPECHALYHRGELVEADTAIAQLRLPTKIKMEVRLARCAVHVHHAGATYTLKPPVQSLLSEFVRSVHRRCGVSAANSRLIHAGHDLQTVTDAPLAQTRLYVDSHVFVERRRNDTTCHLVTPEGDVIPVVRKPTTIVSRLPSMAHDRHANTFCRALNRFLQWRFPPSEPHVEPQEPNARRALSPRKTRMTNTTRAAMRLLPRISTVQKAFANRISAVHFELSTDANDASWVKADQQAPSSKPTTRTYLEHLHRKLIAMPVMESNK